MAVSVVGRWWLNPPHFFGRQPVDAEGWVEMGASVLCFLLRLGMMSLVVGWLVLVVWVIPVF